VVLKEDARRTSPLAAKALITRVVLKEEVRKKSVESCDGLPACCAGIACTSSDDAVSTTLMSLLGEIVGDQLVFKVVPGLESRGSSAERRRWTGTKDCASGASVFVDKISVDVARLNT